MCYGCWTELGKPKMRTTQIERVAELVKQLYALPGGGVGGNLHIVTDDWNLETPHIESCRNTVIRIQGGDVRQYDDADPSQLVVEREIADLMLLMTEQERGAALALEAGFTD